MDSHPSSNSLRALLDHGAGIDSRDTNGDTPLLYYVWNGRWDAALPVLDRGADIHAQNKQSTTLEAALDNQKSLVDRMQQALPDGYNKVKAAIEHDPKQF
jgi:ankyrin repeat protein